MVRCVAIASKWMHLVSPCSATTVYVRSVQPAWLELIAQTKHDRLSREEVRERVLHHVSGIVQRAAPTDSYHTLCRSLLHTCSQQAAGSSSPDLVVARGTRLEVYSLNYGTTPATSSSSSSSSSHPNLSAPPAVVSHCRLELVGSWQCWGVIEDLAVLRGRGSSGQRDSLVLAVRDAKVALVEWDDQLHCLRNGSLHSFEGDLSLREGCPCGTGMTLRGNSSSSSTSTSSHLSAAPIVAADPNGRCTAALVYGRHLALLPAIQADVLEMLLQEGGAVKGSTSSASVGNSYLVHLAKVPSLKLASDCAVRAMTFLHGYTEPVLLLLHETTPTWGGRLREAHDTCALSAMSINVRKKRQPVIWSVPRLPATAAASWRCPVAACSCSAKPAAVLCTGWLLCDGHQQQRLCRGGPAQAGHPCAPQLPPLPATHSSGDPSSHSSSSRESRHCCHSTRKAVGRQRAPRDGCCCGQGRPKGAWHGARSGWGCRLLAGRQRRAAEPEDWAAAADSTQVRGLGSQQDAGGGCRRRPCGQLCCHPHQQPDVPGQCCRRLPARALHPGHPRVPGSCRQPCSRLRAQQQLCGQQQ
ncbi:hypothetical protein COO60DRAFT_92934 [Scenedesmus sp. NREL 46B-D3]|nr:hypothetical protein COO60DRAFT_92934 [Scenedesmus sp. NREL 46B-D3]